MRLVALENACLSSAWDEGRVYGGLSVAICRIDATKCNMNTRKRHGNGHSDHKRTSMNMRKSFLSTSKYRGSNCRLMAVRRFDMSCERI